MLVEAMPLLMFATICLVLLLGYPVAFSLAGTAMIFAGIGIAMGQFDPSFLAALPSRLFGIVSNTTLIAVPLFVLMGVLLEKSRLAEQLLGNMAALFGRRPGGLGFSVILVGMLLAASTGIVGATVVTMGLLSLPTMLNRGYDPRLATGVICATGTLGQIIPPSIALVLLGDTLSSAYQQAQLDMGVFSPDTLSVGDLFIGALLPGLGLVAMYLGYMFWVSVRSPDRAPAALDLNPPPLWRVLQGLIPPVLLIFTVLGSILLGAATPTEAAGVGALGAALLAAAKGQLGLPRLGEVGRETLKVTSMVFMILVGAAVFSLVFRGFGGDELIEHFFAGLPGGVMSATIVVMLVIFLLGFILDFIEITFVVVPIVGPILLAMGVDPIWLGIMIAINLQTSFLTPPFGFALFYLRGVAPASVPTSAMYRGIIPFIIMQLLMLLVLAQWPQLATWLPAWVKGG
ncbi:TRAP transporter large permease subunit [Spongiibacter taiwanensis]|uniref:TRAP transporter large permease n=1 Tax=Spongiibacter taiwanensis TaxID=1748242 RepID=UPI0020361987|nr:TRAP transporter large permease subunit [Spongiibacter taiwanensis]USA41655.1 TRAP transporter large permease subunit [Spongiibacter taiwanensis]